MFRDFASVLTTRDGLIAQLDAPRSFRAEESRAHSRQNRTAALAQVRTSSRRSGQLLRRLRSASA